ncbi:response regulator [Halioglobus maricola]|uniref:Chemotaxis protein CheA n=1 Tax=Halioglobus maricola TaxID=2601894 RepID=A0A5P9NNR6_9GAMM|nr:Hpt domain-containing protein [Halioglobus maricola]QFU77085.1 response regulator [Halioglobus maricola]
MTQFVDFVALGWVEKNLRDEMEAARTCLHRYQREPDTTEHLLEAERNIHMAAGALRLCALDPAAILAEEIERVLGELREGNIAGDKSKLAMTELVAAIEALPAYLASVRAKREVTPGSIATVVNDLRALDHRASLPESLFFNPPLPDSAGINRDVPVALEDEIKSMAKQAMKSMHQHSEAAIKSSKEALSQLRTAGGLACHALAGTPLEPYFRCFTAYAEALGKGTAQSDEVTPQLFQHCFDTLRLLEERGYDALDRAGAAANIKKMLYYIGKQKRPTKEHKALLKAFRIEDVERYTAATEDHMIQEDDLLDALQQTQQQLVEVMGFLAGENNNICTANTTLSAQTLPSLQQVGLQLHVVGLPEQASVINEQFKVLRGYAEQDQPADPADLVDFGGALSNVRDTIEYKLKHGLSAEGDAATLDLEAAITEQVTRCLRGMKEQINREFSRRDLIALTSTAPEDLQVTIGGLRPLFRAARQLGETDLLDAVELWEQNGFPTAVTLLTIGSKLLQQFGDDDFVASARSELEQVLSVLGMLAEKEQETAVLASCANYLERAVEMGGLINDDSMQCFASSIAALEQYMESRLIDPKGNPAQHLRRAQSLSQELEAYTSRRANMQNPEGNIVEFATKPSLESEILDGTDDASIVDLISGEAVVEDPDALAEELLAMEVEEAEEAPATAVASAGGEAPWRDGMAHWAGAAIARAPEPLQDGPEGEIDQELRECFVEECEDYVKRLDAALPGFQADPTDKKAIGEIRVVFHTMKGSAKTIELHAYGEFMHDLEIIFNSLRDGYITGTVEIAEFVGIVAGKLATFSELIAQRIPLEEEDFAIPHSIAAAMADKSFTDAFTVTLPETGAADDTTTDAAEVEEVEEAVEEASLPYAAELWTDNSSTQLLTSITAVLEEAAASENRAAIEQAEELIAAAVPALVELRDAADLTLSTENVAYLFGLSRLEHIASGAVYGLVESSEGQSRIELSTRASDKLYAYLDLINDTEALIPVHNAAIRLLCTHLSLTPPEEEDTAPAAPMQAAPDNVVVLRKQAIETQPAEESDIDTELLDLFIETLDEYTESIDSALTALTGGDDAALRDLKNTLHTVKGAANSIGLTTLGAMVHDFETQLGELEYKGEISSKEARASIEGLASEFHDATRFVRVNKTDWNPNLASGDASEEALEQAAIEQAADRGDADERRTDTLRVDTPRIDKLLDMGLEISMSNVRTRQALDAAGADRNEVQSLSRRVLTLVDQLSLQLDTEIQAKSELTESEHFDPLEMDRLTEKQGLAAILREAAYDLQEESREMGMHLDDAQREAQSSSRLLQTNQSELRQLRLVEFSRLGPGLRRLVHQVSRQLGKEIDFIFDCGKGGLDIRVFEQIRVALEHMLRNAIDHGVGTPNERQAQGKVEHGNVKLSISRSGSEFLIRLVDDGNGIDPDAMIKKAIGLGLISKDENISDADALRLIFRSGFTTAKQVTDVSGRGVGMDAVYQAISQAGGSVDIQSKPGFYTQFDVRVPASIMVNEALLATVGEEEIAIPLTSLKGSEFHRRDDIHKVATETDGRISFRGEQYEVRYLGVVRGTAPQPTLEAMPDFVPVLFAQHNRRRVAFYADGLSTAEDMVIRTLGVQYTNVPGIAGGAVKSDGQPVLALDLNEFILQVEHADTVSASDSHEQESSTLVLCVDDSVMMRRTYEKRLASLGYKVVTAVDGADALDYLSQATQIPDFIFTDLEMPNMNGFDFIANLRRAPDLTHIPCIMVSSRDADKHRAEAERVGANGFLAKGANTAEGMQAVINRHLQQDTAMVS